MRKLSFKSQKVMLTDELRDIFDEYDVPEARVNDVASTLDLIPNEIDDPECLKKHLAFAEARIVTLQQMIRGMVDGVAGDSRKDAGERREAMGQC